jgi:hypothetical protein
MVANASDRHRAACLKILQSSIHGRDSSGKKGERVGCNPKTELLRSPNGPHPP